jgi:hypothetical protein
MKRPFQVRFGLINKTFKLAILITFVFAWSQNLLSQNSRGDDTGIESIGILKPFWRNHPVLGPHLQTELWLDETDTVAIKKLSQYDLTSHPEIGSYGQSAPPDDPDEWYETVRHLCRKLTDLLGSEKANKLRFRIGTEMNGTAYVLHPRLC